MRNRRIGGTFHPSCIDDVRLPPYSRWCDRWSYEAPRRHQKVLAHRSALYHAALQYKAYLTTMPKMPFVKLGITHALRVLRVLRGLLQIVNRKSYILVVSFVDTEANEYRSARDRAVPAA